MGLAWKKCPVSILPSVNPQYDKRLFIEFLEKYKLRACMLCTYFFFLKVLTFKTIFVHNKFWTCIFRGIQFMEVLLAKVKELCLYLAPIKFLEFAQEKEGLGKKKQMFCANFRPNGNWIETSIIHLKPLQQQCKTAFLIDNLRSLWPWFTFTFLST